MDSRCTQFFWHSSHSSRVLLNIFRLLSSLLTSLRTPWMNLLLLMLAIITKLSSRTVMMSSTLPRTYMSCRFGHRGIKLTLRKRRQS